MRDFLSFRDDICELVVCASLTNPSVETRQLHLIAAIDVTCHLPSRIHKNIVVFIVVYQFKKLYIRHTHNLKVFNLSRKSEFANTRKREPISSHCVLTCSPLSHLNGNITRSIQSLFLELYSQFSILNWFSFTRQPKCSSFTWKDLIFSIPFFIYHAIL